MGRTRYIACALLMLCPLALSRHDDDFAFDNSDEFQVELTANHSEIAKNGLRRLWGVPDTSAYIGHLFRMEIPKEAFSGQVVAYKVRREDGRSIPSWLAVDSRHGLISGIPQKTDLGAHTFAVTAIGNTQGLTATDSFTIEVKKAQDKPHSKYGSCIGNENRLVLALLIDGSFNKITPRQRIRALMQLAHFMGLDGEEFWMEPYKTEHLHAETILSGAGSTQKKRGDGTTAIYLNVGCGSRLWARHKVVVAGVREQARDGTLEHLARLPLTGWRLLAARPAPRPKRQVQDYGSGDDEEYGEDDVPDYSGYDDDDEDDYNRNDIALAPEPVDPPTPAPHPHRHHHGEPHTTTDTFQTETPATTVAPTIQTSITTPLPDPTDLYTNPDLFAKSDLAGNSDLSVNSVNLGNSDQSGSSVNLGNSDQSLNSVNLGNADQSASSDISSNVDFLTPGSPPSPSSPPPVPASPPLPATEDLPTREDTTPEPASTNSYTTEEHKVKISPYSESASESNSINFTMPVSINPRRLDENIIISPGDMSTTPEPEMQTVEIRASNELPPTSTSQAPAPLPPPIAEVESPTTQPSPPTPTPAPTRPTSTEKSTTPTPILTTPTTLPTTTPVPETTLQEVTKQDTVMPTEGKSTIIGQTTETVTFAIPVNQPPTLKHHMKKLAIIAGKAFRYIIPADLFMDPEEGSNLTFTMYEAESVPLSKASWIQFIPSSREVYGLPLESHVSRWNFMVEAADSEGLVARGPLDITVQQHKSGRTINHQFLMQFKLQHDYPNAIDWQIRALEGIVNLFRDTDMDHLTVLNATQTGDMYEFVWTNDTLPKDPACPMDDINRLMKIMESEGSQGSPSASLARAMSPELSVERVWWRGAGRCAPASPSPPSAPAPSPDTYPPVTRNQVDHLTATPGHLLIYKVPDDTFFDPEDGGTRNLALSLRYSDRSPLGARHWLQFDARNQEFYGLPAPTDEGAVSYQLIAEDSSKKSAYDSLIVEVVKAPTIRPTVEFQMTMEYPFPMLAHDANNKRKVVEKLAALFGQKETDNIRIQSITDNPTTIIWYNTSLPMDRCPKAEIEELRRMIIQDERGSIGSALKENVDLVFDKDFKVMSIRLIPLGLCAEQNTKTPKTPIQVQSGSSNLQNSKAGNAADQEYLVTFIIPAVVIVCMILLAGVIACVLYRRRRTGKMSVGDEEERQAFRSKAPVIFQDELEERGAGSGSARHCSPVIMREEKPPLLPAPLYRPDAPYRPPPPFAATTTPPRPKPTPTYRKPPPYVPP